MSNTPSYPDDSHSGFWRPSAEIHFPGVTAPPPRAGYAQVIGVGAKSLMFDITAAQNGIIVCLYATGNAPGAHGKYVFRTFDEAMNFIRNQWSGSETTHAGTDS